MLIKLFNNVINESEQNDLREAEIKDTDSKRSKQQTVGSETRRKTFECQFEINKDNTGLLLFK